MPLGELNMEDEKLKDFFDRKTKQYNQVSFIKDDPISIPHSFTQKQDIEIAGFFSALFAWGNRTSIINSSKKLIGLMQNAPYEFVTGFKEADLIPLMHFAHRTFNPTDLFYTLKFLKQHYQTSDSLETAFSRGMNRDDETTENVLNAFHNYFFSIDKDFPPRTKKHVAAPFKKSSCKRLNMFLRWMVRNDDTGVDFGLWKEISPSQLVCPIDVHVSRVAKRFGLIKRNQTDWMAALELTKNLKRLDPHDPVKYDFALFGLGVIEKF
jgi:uncharacterized protein (TIGR02757 family)